jgi:GT2 family glycosyltransferase
VVVVNSLGSSAQRNAGIAAVPRATHVFFFDDDAVVREDYLENAMRFFHHHDGVVGITGRVLLDGANAQEVPLATAERALSASSACELTGTWRPCRDLYGCNFAYARAGSAGDQLFDERLPLYGWLEDQDFARRLMRAGTLATLEDCVIVHRGIRSGGRVNHRRFGYSQIANPAYLARKGSFPLWLALYQAVQPLAKNVAHSLRHEERRWRRERFRGNALAVGDLLRGRFTPERVLDL